MPRSAKWRRIMTQKNNFMKLVRPPKLGEKIVVGMSGGVDSSVALLLLQKAGWNVVGVSLKLPVWQSQCNLLRENLCCTQESLDIARMVCQKVGAPYFIYDAQKDFQKEVADYFVSEYGKLNTPNPCIVCNRNLKFKKLLEFAKSHGIKYVATGHYARTKLDKKTMQWHLLRGKDKQKDQSYNLSFLPAKYLSKIIFPLGDLQKSETYNIAKENGLNFFEKKKQSQDFCYVAGKSLPEFLKEKIGQNPGDIVDEKGKILGKHFGLHFYTLGQRRGIKLSGGPFYVSGFQIQKNQLIVGHQMPKSGNCCLLKPVNWLSEEVVTNCLAQARYHQKPVKVSLAKSKGASLLVRWVKPTLLTMGQYCVFYKGDICLGSGKIVKISQK